MTKAGAPTSALVADDDVEFRTFLVEFLRSEGFEVDEAANGLETLPAGRQLRTSAMSSCVEAAGFANRRWPTSGSSPIACSSKR